MLTFNQFLKKYNLKNKSTSNIEIKNVNPDVEVVTKSQPIKTKKTESTYMMIKVLIGLYY